MSAYFARLGARPWAKKVTPFIGITLPIGYLYFHMFGHKIIRNLFVARDDRGRIIELSDSLKSLIISTHNDIKDQYNQAVLGQASSKYPPTPMKWFAAATVEPINFGMGEQSTGVIIGLPHSYNMVKPEDVPDSMIKFENVQLFQINSDSDSSDADQKKKAGDEIIPPWEIERRRQDPEVKRFIDSLLLSDDGKRFSIARELFYTDSYRPMFVASAMLASIGLSISLSRLAVSLKGLDKGHLKYRLVAYFLIGSFGYLNFSFLSSCINRFYSQEADRRTIQVSEVYRKGAIEYFQKLKDRNLALRELFKAAKRTYDENGDLYEPPGRRQQVPIAERLLMAEELDKTDDVNEKSSNKTE